MSKRVTPMRCNVLRSQIRQCVVHHLTGHTITPVTLTALFWRVFITEILVQRLFPWLLSDLAIDRLTDTSYSGELHRAIFDDVSIAHRFQERVEWLGPIVEGGSMRT